MIALMIFVIYGLLGVCTLALAIRFAPGMYYEWERSNSNPPGRWVRSSYDAGFDFVLTATLWPLAIFAVLGYKVANSAKDSLNSGITLRAQLEKDLAKANKEIDELLKQGK